MQTTARECAGGRPRVDWIDMAKGIGILLVIWAHIDRGPLCRWIYSFHMPLFFFLSGCVFSDKYGFSEFLRRKCRSFVLPYFALGIPVVVFMAIRRAVKTGLTPQWTVDLLRMLLEQKRFQTLWFMACLLFLNLLFYGLFRLLKKPWMIGTASLLLAAAGLLYYHFGGKPLPWNADVCLTAAPFFFTGWLTMRYGEPVLSRMKLLWHLPIGLCAWGGNFALYETVKRLYGDGRSKLEMYASRYEPAYLTYAAAFCGIAGTVALCRAVRLRPIVYIGRHSLFYYAWHQAIMMPLAADLMKDVGLDVILRGNEWRRLAGCGVRFALVLLWLTACQLLWQFASRWYKARRAALAAENASEDAENRPGDPFAAEARKAETDTAASANEE